ncbi:cytochrome ubiquinol oxidase subunit II [Methylobacterium gnaphalii]|uniref:Ubiquinol oxidase polypeptide II n=2 Tax=Methylobacterium gnaphalii TaxID=1010610 RepID=A0A512JH88_9HYPH|nr:cytochrome ubiquinol oxidase subunit II [Methylobacterium gnaphalii]GLS51611.1 cytochrome ubiquinol oxidase subunit II [Methylobacterium gnaphalii]
MATPAPNTLPSPSPARHRRGPAASARRLLQALALPPLFVLLSGCNLVVMNPAGDVAVQQRNLVLASTGLMLLIILPVIGLTLWFAWRYRASNENATYDPEWHHSTQLEVVIWTAPLLIVIALGALTWISTHTLDPFRPLGRLAPNRPIPADVKPLEVEAVALDWKWLFFYPELGIATVNELAAPVDRPLSFKLTATSVMNAFYVPALAGMIYAMPGMETKLHAVINKEGVYDGLASQYSGSGFSRMTFKFHGLSNDGFDKWVDKVKQEGAELGRDAYLELEKPSEAVAPRYYKSYESGLFTAIVNLCAQPGKMCMNEMMRIDAAGGAGKDSAENRERLQYDNRRILQGEEAPGATVPAAGRAPRSEDAKDGKPDPSRSGPDMNQDKAAPAQRHHH